MIEFPKFSKADDKPAPRWFHVAVAVAMLLGAAASFIGTLRTSQSMKALVEGNTKLVEENAKLVRASSTPLLTFSHGNASNDGQRQLEFEVANVGTGPARVVWFELKLDGKPMNEMASAINSLVEGGASRGTLRFTSSPIAARILASNTNVRIFSWKAPDESNTALNNAWDALNKARFERIEVEACFCSALNQCWQSKLNADVPKAVDKCDATGRVNLFG